MQREREFSVRVIQGLQSLLHQQVVRPVLASTRPPELPLALRVLVRIPVLRDLPARLMALGVRRPQVRSPAMASVRVPGKG